MSAGKRPGDALLALMRWGRRVAGVSYAEQGQAYTRGRLAGSAHLGLSACPWQPWGAGEVPTYPYVVLWRRRHDAAFMRAAALWRCWLLGHMHARAIGGGAGGAR